ncbi:MULTISPECIES: efflux RND transporter periplasmic adaptor subunit [Microbacterium]|uniref:efflux RND transporter periplasmic adaptor subunit n=1 Tax=Microbacterium TaxID=33882 RepID=UPI0027832BC8|nr:MULTISPECIES: efflux RND transporter periplasmic adaptor subunit [Microbacterium]MDQ1076333.1 macrolide-specific efflux system membrane fusion protein [Microbacterium sp. SORGH_AS_0969]MDQ1116571.1 macrolide-specific efflux system membrane fusion protein [Microbacterium testaceum]
MGIARTWVFPILRLLLVALVAAALIKLAFFPDRPADTFPAEPTGAIVEPRVAATLGTITNDVVVAATVAADPAVPVKSTAGGVVNKIFITQGSGVNQGDVIFNVKVTIERDPADSVDAEGKPKPAIFRYEDVTAPAGGTLSSLAVIEGQEVTVGMAAGNVAPPSFSVTGTLEAAQQYRLLNRPTEASVAITGGPAPFTCTNLRLVTPLAGSSGDGESTGGSGTSSSAGGSGTTVTCAVPSEVTVFAGLAAEMTIAGGKAENVLVVPTTAVRGAAQSGTVWVSTADGATEERPVALGLTDGTQVEITQGLTEGEEVLEFAPGAMAGSGAGDNCTTYPDGTMFCESVPAS